MEMPKIAEMLRTPAKEIFENTDPDHALLKAIVTGIQHYDEPQFVVIDEHNNLDAVSLCELTGKMVAMTITFSKQEAKDFLEKAAPDLAADIDNPGFKTAFGPWMFKAADAEKVCKYPELEPVSYVGFQKILMENLEEIANTWYDKLSK
ncbi:hypothetical protein [Acidaminococcus fermentans]|uniref:hypothetical protein n=1 Tax=Acidaminococcus fermentans TaxID=905 RepID=UPI003078F617